MRLIVKADGVYYRGAPSTGSADDILETINLALQEDSRGFRMNRKDGATIVFGKEVVARSIFILED